MADPLDELLVSVRADTRGFAGDIAQMRSAFDSVLVDGFAGAGSILERSLLAGLRKGSLGFDDLKRNALSALDQIAARALSLGVGSVLPQGSGLGGVLTGLLGSLLGLPGRATGGIVAPDRPYLVGERGPEVFVPTSAGQVLANAPTPAAREVRVAINLNPERGATAPVALQRSSRQLASAVRRALS
ncbi:tail tape measure protein [Qipengyuania sediminis]|uniref:tail tape measure protein n=1 Tax=Qipengyuania sediminis TaxID=1532023 RepID=UPI001059DDAA|nr:tail tape measure protein [Qipengyuania sediminis]